MLRNSELISNHFVKDIHRFNTFSESYSYGIDTFQFWNNHFDNIPLRTIKRVCVGHSALLGTRGRIYARCYGERLYTITVGITNNHRKREDFDAVPPTIIDQTKQ